MLMIAESSASCSEVCSICGRGCSKHGQHTFVTSEVRLLLIWWIYDDMYRR